MERCSECKGIGEIDTTYNDVDEIKAYVIICPCCYGRGEVKSAKNREWNGKENKC